MSGLPEHSMSDMHLDIIGFDEAEPHNFICPENGNPCRLS